MEENNYQKEYYQYLNINKLYKITLELYKSKLTEEYLKLEKNKKKEKTKILTIKIIRNIVHKLIIISILILYISAFVYKVINLISVPTSFITIFVLITTPSLAVLCSYISSKIEEKINKKEKEKINTLETAQTKIEKEIKNTLMKIQNIEKEIKKMYKQLNITIYNNYKNEEITKRNTIDKDNQAQYQKYKSYKKIRKRKK